MTITVNAVNDAPVGGDTSDQTIHEDAVVSLSKPQLQQTKI